MLNTNANHKVLRVDEDTHYKLNILRATQRKSIKVLVMEAVELLVEKYDETM